MPLNDLHDIPDRQEYTEYLNSPSETAVKPAAEAAKKDPSSFSAELRKQQANSMLYKVPTVPQPSVADSVVFRKDAPKSGTFDAAFGSAPVDGKAFPLTGTDPLGDIQHSPVLDSKSKLAEAAPKKEPGGKFDQKNHDKSEMTVKTLNPDVIAKVGDPEIKDMINQIVDPKTNESDTVALTRKLQGKIVTTPDGAFGPKSLAALESKYPPAETFVNKAKKMTEAEKVAYDEKMGRELKALGEFVNSIPKDFLEGFRDGMKNGLKNPKYGPDKVTQIEQTIAMVDARISGKPSSTPANGTKTAPTEQVAAKAAVKETSAASAEGIKA